MNLAVAPRRLASSHSHFCVIDDDLGDTRRLRIIYAATREFLSSGVDGANLDEIAITASVGKATIYKFFRDKSDLFIHCVLSAVMDTAAPLRDILDIDLPIDQVLRRLAALHITRMIQPVFGGRPFYEMARTLVGASISHAELAAQCKSIFRQNLGVPLIRYFQAKIARGEIKGDARFLCEHFSHIIFFTNSVILEPETAPRPDQIDEMARRTVDIFLNGCRA